MTASKNTVNNLYLLIGRISAVFIISATVWGFLLAFVIK